MAYKSIVGQWTYAPRVNSIVPVLLVPLRVRARVCGLRGAHQSGAFRPWRPLANQRVAYHADMLADPDPTAAIDEPEFAPKTMVSLDLQRF